MDVDGTRTCFTQCWASLSRGIFAHSSPIYSATSRFNTASSTSPHTIYIHLESPRWPQDNITVFGKFKRPSWILTLLFHNCLLVGIGQNSILPQKQETCACQLWYYLAPTRRVELQSGHRTRSLLHSSTVEKFTTTRSQSIQLWCSWIRSRCNQSSTNLKLITLILTRYYHLILFQEVRKFIFHAPQDSLNPLLLLLPLFPRKFSIL